MKKFIDILPLVVFSGLLIVLFSFLSEKDDQLETVLIDSSFPNFSLPALSDDSMVLTKEDISELPALINVWATWCIACRIEHPFLMRLKEDSEVTIYGLNYKDNFNNAQNFLKKLGNPYETILLDEDGTTSIEWGAYGVPETFLIHKNKIVSKYIGPLNEELINEIYSIIK